MKKGKFIYLGLALAVAACAHTPAPAIVAAAPAPDVTAPPAPLAAPAPQPAIDPTTLAAAQRNLKALGYAVGKTGDLADPAFQRAIIAFEKDQGLTEDGLLSSAIVDRLKMLRAALLKSAATDANRSAIFVYSDGSGRKLGLAMPPPDGLASNAPANFMLPMKPGSQASYQLGKGAKEGGFKALMTVTCQAGRAAQANTALGQMDAVAVECRGDGANPPHWRSLYGTALGVVVQQESAGGVRDLVALRPFTNNWPSAARTGLDWALTHALEAATPSAPVQWSSTGVAPHFEIRAAARLSGQEAGLGGKYAQQVCRRFEMVQSGAPALHYPGIACQAAAGVWSLPGSAARLAAPASGVAARSLPAALRSVRN
jgi:peptidoglycan hydrolase-like protein with peptidoglycan-binding domain